MATAGSISSRLGSLLDVLTTRHVPRLLSGEDG